MLLTFKLILNQARRQSSVTGGQKNIWEATDQFYPQLRGGRPKKTNKKGLHRGRLPFFGAQVSLGGRHVHIAWRDAAESNGGDLASCPRIQG